MKRIDFDAAGLIKPGKPVTVHLQGRRPARLGQFMGMIPAKETGTVRDRSPAIVVRSGDLISYYRRDDVCDIEVDGRHLTKGTVA